MNWFYSKDGQQLGPVAFAEIERLLAAGELTGESLVWQEGTPTWVKLSTVLPAAAAPAPADAPVPFPPAAPAVVPATSPVLSSPSALPDYGSFLCWGILAILIPCVGLPAYIALVVFHCLEFFAVRKEVTAGTLAPTKYSEIHPALFIAGLICCGSLLYPLFMYFREKSGYFKPQPSAVVVAIIAVVLGWIIGLASGFVQYAAQLQTMQQ